MHSVMEDSWKEFEQTGSVRSYLKSRGMTPEQAAARQSGDGMTAADTADTADTAEDGSRAGGLR